MSDFFLGALAVLLFLLSLFLVFIIMIQRGKGGGIAGSLTGTAQSAFGARGGAVHGLLSTGRRHHAEMLRASRDAAPGTASGIHTVCERALAAFKPVAAVVEEWHPLVGLPSYGSERLPHDDSKVRYRLFLTGCSFFWFLH